MAGASCVACDVSGRPSKRIACLHTLCLDCVEPNVQDDGSVKCPKCSKITPHVEPGVSLLQSLPNVYPRTESAAASEHRSRLCAECFEDRPASSHCSVCDAYYCQVHAASHPLSRATRNHKLTAFDMVHPVPGAARPCRLHPSQTAGQYCQDCQQILCKLCMEKGKHSHSLSSHTIVAIEDAAKQAREALLLDLDAYTSMDNGSVISQAMEKVRGSIQATHDQAEAASDKANLFYDSLIKAINKQQEQVLEQVDQLRSKTVLPLEKQLTNLDDSLIQIQSMSDILKSNTDDTDVLLMKRWLGDALKSVKVTAEAETEPCASSSLIFLATDTSALEEGIRSAGVVVDLHDGVLKCPEEAEVGYEMEMTYKVNTLPDQCVPISDLKISVQDPQNTTFNCPTIKPAGNGLLNTNFQPSLTGRHVVSIKVEGRPVACSSVEFIVNDVEGAQFDGARCHSYMKLSNEGRTVRKAEQGFKSACTSTIKKTSGKAAIRMRIDRTCHGCMYLAVCSSSNPNIDGKHTNKQEVFGWNGYPGHTQYNGTVLGHPWQSGDVVRLTLDLDKRTLTGLHERSGTTEVLSDVRGDDFYWYITMGWQEDQVTLLR